MLVFGSTRPATGRPAVGTAGYYSTVGKVAMVNTQLVKGEDELVRRLGMAVADKWGAIPPFAQDQLLDQACEVEISPRVLTSARPSNRFWKGMCPASCRSNSVIRNSCFSTSLEICFLRVEYLSSRHSGRALPVADVSALRSDSTRLCFRSLSHNFSDQERFHERLCNKKVRKRTDAFLALGR